MSRKVTILGHWDSRKAKREPAPLSWGEERTKILLLACCYQEGPGTRPRAALPSRCVGSAKLAPVDVENASSCAGRTVGRTTARLCSLHDAPDAAPLEQPMKINNAVFLSYLHCPYKACLLLEGRSGQRTDYETLMADLDSGYKALAQAALDGGRVSAAAVDCGDNVSGIGASQLVTFDAKIEHGSFECILDALKPEADSFAGGPRYLPVVFCRTERVPRFEELRLALGGHLLSLVQRSRPATGIVINGANCSLKTVRLTPKYPAIERIVAGLVSLATGQYRPPLILNSHCPACEFQQSCADEAKKEGNLSLLHRMTDKVIRQYNHKGIFTINQLSYTFHPRRKSKRVKARGRPHSYALQSMAIRDQKVYVLDLPALPSAETQVFIDMEGDPDDKFVYLIGLLVVRDGQETCHSFWADTREDEALIFDQLDCALTDMANPRLFHYGPYEAHVVKRVASRAAESRLNGIADIRLTNVLSEVYSKIYFPTYSNSLKDIAGYLGYDWRTRGALAWMP